MKWSTNKCISYYFPVFYRLNNVTPLSVPPTLNHRPTCQVGCVHRFSQVHQLYSTQYSGCFQFFRLVSSELGGAFQEVFSFSGTELLFPSALSLLRILSSTVHQAHSAAQKFGWGVSQHPPECRQGRSLRLRCALRCSCSPRSRLSSLGPTQLLCPPRVSSQHKCRQV